MADLNTRVTKGSIIDGSSSYFTYATKSAQLITDDFFGVAIPVGTAGYVNVWNGSSFQLKPVKVWNGSAWVIKPAKFWNGSAWILA